MIKESLYELIEKNYDSSINRTLNSILENCDEQQLAHILYRGVKLSNTIDLFCYGGSGFRCINEDENLIGRNHTCNLIERFLNNKLNKKLNS